MIFHFQPIDWADAIAKRHDKDYYDIQKNDKPGDIDGYSFSGRRKNSTKRQGYGSAY